MDDIIILFHKVIVDLASFNESQFGIFNESERETLTTLFRDRCGSKPFEFIALLSPQQKQHVVVWACQRTTFSVAEMTEALKRFTKYLEGVSYQVYPKLAEKKLKKTKSKKTKHALLV